MLPPRFCRSCCLLLWLFLAIPADAAIIDCRGGTGRSFTVYLDEPDYAQTAFKNDTELRTFMDRLWFFLDQDRDRQWLEERQSAVGFTFCKGRKPSGDGREFDRPLIDLLYNQGVILEIWGTLDAQLDNGEPKNRQARIGYLLVPLEFVGTTDTPSGRVFVRYPENPGESADDFLSFFATRPTLMPLSPPASASAPCAAATSPWPRVTSAKPSCCCNNKPARRTSLPGARRNCWNWPNLSATAPPGPSPPRKAIPMT